MNWTGGRLQRHSKANANAQVKAQKNYFARARLRQSTKLPAPTPLHISISPVHGQQEQSARSLNQSDRKLVSGEARPQKELKQLKTSKRVVHKTSVRNRGTNAQSPRDTPPRVNTLEQIKRSLLKQSDWLGLTGAKPPKPGYRTAAISEQIGRRRRVTKEDRHRQTNGRGPGKVEHNLIRPFAHAHDASAIQLSFSENVSIRIGSNIYQSQTTKYQGSPRKPSSAIPESSATEPMLFDIAEAQVPLPVKETGEYYLRDASNGDYLSAGPADDQEIVDGDGLVPLEQARDFASFDEVKRYSSSAKHATSSSQSVPKQQLQEGSQSQTRPMQYTSSSVVNGKPVDGQGLFSLDGYSHRLPSIGSEPPGLVSHPEDIMEDVVHTTDTGHEVPDLRFLDNPNTVSGTTSSALEKPNRDGPSPRDAALHSRSNRGFRDGSQREVPLGRHRKAPYTIERQVQLEEQLVRRGDYLAASVGARSKMPTDLNLQTPRGSRGAECTPTNESKHPQPRFGTPEAMERINKDYHCQDSQAEPISVSIGHRRQGHENEAWMRDVFSTDLYKLQQRLSFVKAPIRQLGEQTPSRNEPSREPRAGVHQSEWRANSIPSSSDLSLPRTIKTGVNTVLNVPNGPQQSNQRNLFIPSETDFLTQMSPMTGYLDDRIVNLSVHNNAANTIRDFVEAPSVAAKRTACDAFGDNSYDQSDAGSLSEMGDQFSSPGLHRVPLSVLQQAPLRSHPFYDSRFIDGEPQAISKPVWRHEKTPSPLKISRNHRSPASREQFDRTRKPHNRGARFPIDYTPVRVSANQFLVNTHLEAQPPVLLTATSKFSSQKSSSTTTSQHRVPLSFRHVNEESGAGQAERQSFSGVASNHRFDPSARFDISFASKPTAPAPTSSSSDISVHRSTRPMSNIHTNETRPYLFKPRERQSAQYSHPSRAPSGFRAPPPIPQH